MDRVYVVGIPSHAGAMDRGTEAAPDALRRAGLVRRLVERGLTVVDQGDLVDETGLPRHNRGAVRNWPSPRLIWEQIRASARRIFDPQVFTLLLGGDCSMGVGTFSAFRQVFGPQAHLLVLDGHVDATAPRDDVCVGAAGMGLWFLTQDDGTWWEGEPVPPASVSVLGPHTIAAYPRGMTVIPLSQLTRDPTGATVRRHLDAVPADARILLHLDVDVLNESVMPAAYAPSPVGLDLPQARAVLTLLLADPRVQGLEVTEFSPAKDGDGLCARLVVELLAILRARRARVG